MSPIIWIPWVIAIIAVIGSAFITPYHTFFLTAKHGRIEKNIALREKLPESERSRELDYLIAKQTKDYVNKNLRKEITPHPFILILLWVSTFFSLFFAAIIIRIFLPKEIPFLVSIPDDSNISIFSMFPLFLVFFGIRMIISRKAKKTDFSYGYYAAFLGAMDGTQGGRFRTPDDYLLRIPKFSLSEKGALSEVVTHEKIYVDDKETGSFHVFRRHNDSRKTGVAEIKFLNITIDTYDILVFNYSYEDTILADEILMRKEKIFVIPKFEPMPEIVRDHTSFMFLNKMKNFFETKETLMFYSLLSKAVVHGIRKVSKNESYWKQDKTLEKPTEPSFTSDDGYPVFH